MMKFKTFFQREYIIFSLILISSILLFWWRVWIPSPADRMHFSDDILIKDYPTRLGLFRILLSGHLPLWDPYQFGGWPGLANCETGFFYPPNWLMIPFISSPVAAFQATQWIVLLHFFIAGLGMYQFTRFHGLSPYASAFAAFTFTFCGFHCAHKKHTNMLFALVWLPWIFLFAERWLRNQSVRNFIKLVFLLALAYSAGHPQASFYLTLLLGFRMMWGGEKTTYQAWIKRISIIVLLVFLAFGLTAIQWLPTLELIQQGERAGSQTAYQRSSEFSMPLYELLDVLLPDVFQFWGQVEVYYWGIVPFLLLLFYLSFFRFTGIDRFYTILGIITLLFALGEHFFVYDLSYLLIPGTAWVRAPSRWIYFTGFVVAFLAARGLDTFQRQSSGDVERHLTSFYQKSLYILGFFLVLLVLLVIKMHASSFLHAFQAMAADQPPNPQYLEEWRRLLKAIFLLIFFVGSFYFLIRLAWLQKISFYALACILISLTFIDLATHYHRIDLKEGPGGYEVDREIKKIIDSPWNFRTKVFFEGGGHRELYHGSAQDFRELDGQSPLTPRLNLDVREDTALTIPTKPNLELFKLFGVGMILSDVGNLLPVESFNQKTERLYEFKHTPVRSRLFYDWLEVENETQRQLLSIQAFPHDSLAFIVPQEEEHPVKRKADKQLFPKPFLLASCSAQSVQPNAHLIIDGIDHFERAGEGKGYYIAVADSTSGKVEKAASFNLMLSLNDPTYAEHKRMMDFVANIPEGKTVFAAISDNATNMLMPEGLAALRAIGASVDLRSRYQYAHAIVGKKGAPIGSALEIISPTEALAIQTRDHIFTHGVIADKPNYQFISSAQYTDEWIRLFDRLHHERLPARPLLDSSTDRLYFPHPIRVYSAPKGESVKDRASIIVGGQDISPNQVGYNLVVLEPQTFEVEHRESFNLLADYIATATTGFRDPPVENQRMQSLIKSVTDGHVIVGAIRDEAIDLLHPKTLNELNKIGCRLPFDLADAERRKGMAHAFIAVKGATFCVESYKKNGPATVFGFNRYPGGPALMPPDRDDGMENLIIPTDPYDELISKASRTLNVKPLPKAQQWHLEENGPNQLRVTGTTQKDAFLFTSEILYPGWKAYIDGIERPIQRVNYFFRGIPISKGIHTVEMVYQPVMFYTGFWISFITLAGLLAIWFTSKDYY